MKKLIQILFFSILVLQTNYPQWYQQTSGTSYNLNDVSFSDANNGSAVGEGGTVLITTDGGALWSAQSFGTYLSLPGVCFTDPNNGTVLSIDGLGDGGISRTTDGGTTWTGQFSGYVAFFDVSFTDSYNGTVVGYGILRTTDGGSTWTSQTGGNSTLYGVSFTDANNGTAVGGNFGYGIIIRTTNGGSTWTTQLGYPDINELYGVSFTDANNGTAVGAAGIILRTTNGGTTWNAQSSGTTNYLRGVSFSDENNGTAVGDLGTILRTTNGGTTWISQSSGTTNTLRGVSFSDEDNGTAVGDYGTILRYIPQIDSSLVAFYPFNGNTNDESGYGNNGTPYGGGLTNDRFYIQAHAYGFTGFGNHMDCGDPPNNILDLGTNATINAWLRNGPGGIVRKDESPYNNNGWGFDFGGGSLAFYINTPSSGNLTMFSNNWQFEPNYWYNVCVVKQGLLYTFYINGSPAGIDTSWLEVPDVNAQMMIGVSMYGDLDDIRIYNRALTQSEVDSLYHLGGWPPIFFQLSLDITDKWNMVSIPGLLPLDQAVDHWWQYRDPGANVFRYSGGYQAVSIATPGEGYWMKHSGDRTYNTGDEWPVGGIQGVPHTRLAGVSGWNMIGGYEIAATASLITTAPPGQQSGPIYKYSGGYQVATTIDPGHGYWIKLLSAAQIIIPEVLTKETEAVEYFPEDWGKIILTDATGVNYTLYAIKGEVDLSQYELPPAPPIGMFDIRFESGRIAEDINSSMLTIDMSGVTYPLTVRVEGMDMRLMDETGKTVNVNLKSGEYVVIGDATIKKLMVSGELIPDKYSLEQNYPNPFNPSTTIEFSLPENVGNVKLSIYNVLGEKVAELVNTALVAGKYSFQWNANNVATGIYIYELRTEKFVSVKKMLVIK
jgi:photosystem II stability/assembly factor-like uncharacterized protein